MLIFERKFFLENLSKSNFGLTFKKKSEKNSLKSFLGLFGCGEKWVCVSGSQKQRSIFTKQGSQNVSSITAEDRKGLMLADFALASEWSGESLPMTARAAPNDFSKSFISGSFARSLKSGLI